MTKENLSLLNDVNQAIIKLRGIYSIWSSEHNIGYHQMLVLYTIRQHGFCTQKQICNTYLLPKQTINNVIAAFRSDHILHDDEVHSRGIEKAFVLSDKGKEYAAPFLESLDTLESRALGLLGKDKLQTLTDLLLEYDQALYTALEESR